MENFIVRNCEPKEIGRFVELLKINNLYWEMGDSEENFLKKLKHDHESIIVLELNKKIVGMAMFVYDPWASSIWHVVVDPEYQRNGFGQVLVAEIERRLKERGTSSVNGFVATDNDRSLGFFRKLGYTYYPKTLISVEKEFN